jgi:hypothetical protein
MRNRNNAPVVLYGIRHKDDAWLFTKSKADRDFMWDNVSRYPQVAVDWETCERIQPVAMPTPVSIELAPPMPVAA